MSVARDFNAQGRRGRPWWLAALLLLTALPAQEDQLNRRLEEAYRLYSQGRHADTLLKLDEIAAAFPPNANYHNLRGAVLLTPGLRDPEQAEAEFQKAAALEPGAMAPVLNLAELEFIRHHWAEAQRRFAKVLEDYPKMPLQVRHLIWFKVLVCQLRQEQVEAAEATLKAQFTFMDDTPAYYFSKAAIAFQKKDEPAAQEWLAKAAGIFGDKAIATYVDCLLEVRWVTRVGAPSSNPEP